MPVTNPATSWNQGLDLPTRLFGTESNDYELYEEDGEFVFSVEMPGFDPDEISVNWYEDRLNISAEHVDEDRGRKKTFHRAFRVPKEVEPDEITAEYTNGVLEVRLPIAEDALTRGKSIEVQG